MSGLEIIRIIQSFSNPALDRFFLTITDLHHENIYIVTLPLLLWFYEKSLARYMISVFVISVWSNGALKEIFNTTRPSPEIVRQLVVETSGAFPSGHAQGPIMFWGALVLEVGKRWFTLLMAAIVFLIGLSRLYVGIHWPLDVIGGWLIGALMLWGFALSRPFWMGEHMVLARRLLWATLIPLMTLALWRSAPWDTPKDLAGHSWLLTGAFLGFWIGVILEEHFVGFDPRQGTWIAHGAKAVIGLAILFGVKEGVKLFLEPIALNDLVRYFLVAFTATFLAPLLFRTFTRTPSVTQDAAG